MYNAVAQVLTVIVEIAVLLVHERGIGLDGVLVQTRLLEPFVFPRPQQLNRVALTQQEGVGRYLVLFRTDDDVVEVGAVAVVNDRIIAVLHTVPFALPCVFETAAFTVLEPWIDGITQDNAVIDVRFQPVLADIGRVVLVQRRNDEQGQVDQRITAVNGGVGVRIGTLCPDGIGVLATEDVRQVLFTDRIGDVDCITTVDHDVYLVDCVAFQGVVEYCVGQVNLVKEGYAVELATVQINGRLLRYFEGQVEGVYIYDVTVLERGVCIETGGVVALAVVAPNVRGVEYAEVVHNVTVLGDDIQGVRDLATRHVVMRNMYVRTCDQFGDRVAFPEDGVAQSDHLGLGQVGQRRYVDLIEDRAVAGGRTRTVGNRVAEHRIYRHTCVAIYLIIDRARRACTYVLAYNACRYGVNIEVQRVELLDMFVCVEDGVGLDAGGVVTLAVLCPYERSVRDTDGLVQPRLFYNVQDTDAVTSGSDRYSLLVVAA